MELLAQFTGEVLVCGLLNSLLYQPPDKAHIASLYAEGVFAESPLGNDRDEVQQGLSLLRAWGSSAWEQDPDQAFDDLAADYFYLFNGPGKVQAPPWESVFFSKERLIFQEQTLQVRAWYQKFGLQIENLHHEPDDHIGLQLGFLAHLAQMTVQALEQGKNAEAEWLIKEQSAFLSQHLLRWASMWCDLVEKHARSDFYRGVSLLVRGALQEAAELVKRTEAIR